MNKVLKILVIAIVGLFSLNIMAKDIGNYPISNVLNSNDAKTRLGDSVQFYFGDQSHPKIIEKLGKIKTSNRTNAFWKNDSKVCRWVFLSSLRSLRDKAKDLGANAVINVKSNIKNVAYSNQKTYRCDVGFLMANTALVGEAVKIKK